MNSFVCLLRGINVGGHRKMSMAALRSVAESFGCQEVQTYLQSGNLILRSPASPSDLESVLKSTLLAETGHEVVPFVFLEGDFREVVSASPFSSQSCLDPKFQHLTFIKDSDSSTLKKQSHSTGEGEEVEYRCGNFFLYCPNGYGRTKLTNGYFERISGSMATTRNWRTVNALISMLDSAT
ncbi:DUF1697 domain-containing protein [bacterium]|jgi:uncharacterized protein (DUF1697 family)|nr:DUF1697 domain-containing protein [Verrucomicrobiota bacterium]MDA7632580.1 DUF1697 domain-containing protein [bacterium]